MLMSATSDNVEHTKGKHGSLLQHFTGHLNKKELLYLRDWDRLIDLEAHVSNHHISRAWLTDSYSREKNTGKCMSSLVYSEFDKTFRESNIEKEKYFQIKFERSIDSKLKAPLNGLKIEIGSRVVLSSDGTSLYQVHQKKNFAILRGTVKEVDACFVVIHVGEMDTKRINRIHETGRGKVQLFRLDKDDFTVGTGTLRQNLIELFAGDIPPFAGKLGLTQELLSSIHEKTKRRLPCLRQNIIHLKAPTFERALGSIFQSSVSKSLQGCDIQDLSKEFEHLNSDQQHSICKVRTYYDVASIYCSLNVLYCEDSYMYFFCHRLYQQKIIA
jgi:hypothetical protein